MGGKYGAHLSEETVCFDIVNTGPKTTFKSTLEFQRKLTMKTVLTYGTYDLLHYGHIELLRRSKQLGDTLIVGLSSDEFNEVKGKKCVFSYEKRKELLESIRYVDFIFPELNWEQKEADIVKYKVDIFVMGDDWMGKFDFLKKYCEVVYLPRTKEISTTMIKSLLTP